MSREMIERALKRATDTKECIIGENALEAVGDVFKRNFPGAAAAVIIADPRTWKAAGEKVASLLTASGIAVKKHILEPDGKLFHGDYAYVPEVKAAIQNAVPVAVGSGVVNDLTKRAAGELGTPYMVVGTAASVDGYSSFGAALRSPEGAKQTYPCPAPRAIVADLDVMRTAPAWMAASGFADLMAKVPAGADWILAAELGAAEWHEAAWHTVQDGLKDAIADAQGVRRMQTAPLTRFVEGLMLGGFAMQDMQSSRPASGAEHMFSHLLEMRNHTCKGAIVPHGIQVGVFTLFMCRMYEQFIACDYSKMDVEAVLANWKSLEEAERIGREMFAGTPFPDIGVKAARAKFIDRDATRARLLDFKARWPEIKTRLENQLLPAAEIERRLAAVGAPTTPEGIGSTKDATLADAVKTVYMRDRYMLLDFLDLTGQLAPFARRAVEKLKG